MILVALYKCRACGHRFKIHCPELGDYWGDCPLGDDSELQCAIEASYWRAERGGDVFDEKGFSDTGFYQTHAHTCGYNMLGVGDLLGIETGEMADFRAAMAALYQGSGEVPE